MKFLCIDCDAQMHFEERQQPGDGTFAAAFACPTCGRRVAMLANPMETQLVNSLGVKIGGRTLDAEPMELIRTSVAGRDDAFREADSPQSAVRTGPSGPRTPRSGWPGCQLSFGGWSRRSTPTTRPSARSPRSLPP